MKTFSFDCPVGENEYGRRWAIGKWFEGDRESNLEYILKSHHIEVHIPHILKINQKTKYLMSKTPLMEFITKRDGIRHQTQTESFWGPTNSPFIISNRTSQNP